MTQFPDSLLAGYRTFKDGQFVREQERYHQLADAGQTPETMLIACCDSRAAPETIFNVSPGEIFVVRNVANMVPPYKPDDQFHATSAALEFAVQSLKVKHIVVMGHGRCGGIQAALHPGGAPLSSGDFIGKWMELVRSPAEAVSGNTWMTESERQTALERISIRFSLDNLLTFPWIKDRAEAGKLSLNGAWFDISTGELWILDEASGDFVNADTLTTA